MSAVQARKLFPFTALVSVLAVSLLSCPVFAQRQDPVQVTATVSPAVVHPGEYVTVTEKAAITGGYHIYSIVPPAQPGPFPTEVKMAVGDAKPAGPATESAPETKFDKNFNVNIGVHNGTATFTQVFQVPLNATGSFTPKVSLRYQACDATSCLPPRTKTPSVDVVRVEAGSVRPEYSHPPAGQTVVPSASTRAEGPVEITASVNPGTVHPGEYVTVTATAAIQADHHIYSIVPPAKPGPFPTEVKIAAGEWKAAGPPVESAPKTTFDKNFGVEIGIHEGTATFSQTFQVPQDAKGGVTPTISIRYQVCDSTTCLPPRTKTPAVEMIKLEAGSVRPEYAKLPQAGASPIGGAASPDARSNMPAPVAPKGDSGLLGFLATAFGAGLLALITPCVFPMIPVTIAFFTKQASANNTSIVKLAAIYSLGIIVAFTGIGAILAATIGAAGANRVAANPWTNLIFATLFFVFGLALLEIFELRLPSSLQNLTGKGQQAGGTLGVLLMGLTFVIAAFTCTAPFIGSVLVAASTASSGSDWIKPILGMATFALALALPFFLLALFPGWLARLPRSGAWLSTVKGTMGFLELAAALKFLSNTDLVWQWQVITQPLMLACWTLISVMAGLWLLGILNLGFSTPTGRPTVARGATAALFFAAAFYFLVGLTGRPLAGWLNAFLPLPEYRYNAGKATTLAAEELPYLDSLEKGIAQAKAENKPIFVDFTGYTCTNCRDMELNVFPKPEVKTELEKFVRVRLYTDGGPNGDKNQNYQDKTFQTVALPLYAVLTSDGKPVDSIPYTPDSGKFARFLQQTRERQTAEAR